MNQIVEIECKTCDKVLAYVQVVPNTLLIRGETWCPDCYEEGEG